MMIGHMLASTLLRSSLSGSSPTRGIGSQMASEEQSTWRSVRQIKHRNAFSVEASGDSVMTDRMQRADAEESQEGEGDGEATMNTSESPDESLANNCFEDTNPQDASDDIVRAEDAMKKVSDFVNGSLERKKEYILDSNG